MSVTAFDAMNDALEQGADLGFEMRPGFSTHWPMGADALVALGRADLVHDWVREFIARHVHYDPPEPVKPLDLTDEADWRAARGDFDRVADWAAAFERELAEHGWREVLVTWWPRLVFGSAAALTHGLIRTMHAVRSIDRGGEPTPRQLHELAMGLGYWAARYVELPAAREPHGAHWLPEAIATIPRLGTDAKIGLRNRGFFLHIPEIPNWSEAVGDIATPDDVQRGLSDLTLAFVQAQLAHPQLFPIPQVHTTTAPAAMRVMLGYLPEEQHLPSLVSAWQVCAALVSTFLQEPTPEEVRSEPEDGLVVPTADELVARAVAHGDMHSIKVTEACLREHALRPDPRYLQLAQRIIELQPPFWQHEA